MSKENREKQFKFQTERALKGGPAVDSYLLSEFEKPKPIVPKKKAVKVKK